MTRAQTIVQASESAAPIANVSGPMLISDARGTPAAVAAPTSRSRAHQANANPAPAGEQADDEVLRDHLAHDPRPAGAERQAGGELVLAGQRAADQEAGGVAARDEQERDDGGGERVERRADVARQLLEQAGDHRAGACVGLWVLDREGRGDARRARRVPGRRGHRAGAGR